MFNNIGNSDNNNNNNISGGKMNFVKNGYAYHPLHPSFLNPGAQQFGCGQQQQQQQQYQQQQRYQHPLVTNSFGVFGDYNVNNAYCQPNAHLWPFRMQNERPWGSSSNNDNIVRDNNTPVINPTPLVDSKVMEPTVPHEPSPSCSIAKDLNSNNKRQIDTVSDYDELSVEEFDFDSRRPMKKYICEEKVLEIFDRLHIREGNQYIVEHVPDDEACPPKTNPFRHNVSIEEVFENEDCQLEYSPQLKDALQTEVDITNKLIKLEQEKLSKALVLYRPNPVLKSLRPDYDNNEESSAKKAVQVEEVSSDNDDTTTTEDEMLVEEEDMPKDGVLIEQLPTSDEDSCTDVPME